MSQLFNANAQASVKAPKRIWLWLLPLLIIIILAALLFAGNWQMILPKTKVDVARARLSSSVVIQEGQTLFQAAGWIEPATYNKWASTLVSGTVDKVYVIDGQEVKKGDLLAELNTEDFILELKLAEAKLAELNQSLTDFNLQINTYEAKLVEIGQKKKISEAALKRAIHKHELYKQAGANVIPGFDIEQAELEVAESKTKVDAVESTKAVITAQISQVKNKKKVAEAVIEQQKVKIEQIKLNIERCKIYAPAGGIIFHLYARVGRKHMLGSDNEFSAVIAKIFNPMEVKVRVDVPLSDYSKVKIGQKTKVHLETLNGSLDGQVTSIFGHADYQKNTMEVWVSIPGGHKDLRPSMLAQVAFISQADASNNTDLEEKQDAVFIKKECLDGNSVWVLDSNDQLIQRTVEAGKSEQEGWIELKSGIKPGERVVINPVNLKEGQSVEVRQIHE